MDSSYIEYFKQMQFFSVLGLLINLATYSVCIYIAFKEIKVKDSMNSLPFLLPGKLGKPLLSIAFMMGSCPSYLMPIYTFDYYQCENRNSIFAHGEFPVYFASLMCIFTLIVSLMIAVLLILTKQLQNRLQILQLNHNTGQSNNGL